MHPGRLDERESAAGRHDSRPPRRKLPAGAARRLVRHDPFDPQWLPRAPHHRAPVSPGSNDADDTHPRRVRPGRTGQRGHLRDDGVELDRLLRLRGRLLRRPEARGPHRPGRHAGLRHRRADPGRREEVPRRRQPPDQLGRPRHVEQRLQDRSRESERLLRHGELQLRVPLQPAQGPAHRGPRLLPPQWPGGKGPREARLRFRRRRQRARAKRDGRHDRLGTAGRGGVRKRIDGVPGLRKLLLLHASQRALRRKLLPRRNAFGRVHREQQFHARDPRPDAHEQLVEVVHARLRGGGLRGCEDRRQLHVSIHVLARGQALQDPVPHLHGAKPGGPRQPVPPGRDVHQQRLLGQSGSHPGREDRRRRQRFPGRLVSGRGQRVPRKRDGPGPELHRRAAERLPPRVVQRLRGQFPRSHRGVRRHLRLRARRWRALRDPLHLRLHGDGPCGQARFRRPRRASPFR